MQLSRRDVLKLAALAGLSTWLQACGSNDAVDDEEDVSAELGTSQPSLAKPRILVVGAGIAGLAAAAKLQQSGYSVQILEGRERIGGRIWTSHSWDDLPVDLGASWIHGVEDNPITALADQASITRAPTDYENSVVYDQRGAELSDTQVEQLERQLGQLMEAVAELVENTDDMPLATALQQVLAELPDKPDQATLNFSLNTVIEHEYAADAEELSAQEWDSGAELDGGDVIFPGGYDQVLEQLTAGLRISTAQHVSAIDYTAAPVRVTTDKGVFEAEKVIVTVPLGVLKHASIMFTPALAASKARAIELLGSGLLNKTWLRFPSAFWPREPEIINSIDAQKGRWAEFLNIYHYVDKPVLLGFNAGAYARMLEQLSDAEIISDCMSVLRTLYGADIPEPEAWQITRWGSDEHAFGSYSFVGVGATEALRDTLAAPLDGRLFFAGEATSREYPATVHGAYLSGLRAAEEAMQL